MASASFTVAKASISRVASRAQTSRVVVARAERNLWLPGSTPPAWLDGSLPGDYGFDPIGLGSDPELLKYFTHAEIFHCRWAMLGAAGIALPALFTKMGMMSVPDWWVAGQVSNETSGIPFVPLLTVQMILFGWVELKRLGDIRNPGSQGDGSFFGITDGFKGVGNGYPGGVFDPMGMSKDPANFKKMKQSEIINGRLAMTALVGFVAQHAATGKGPMDNMFDHMANPGNVNFATNGVSFPHPIL